MRTSCTPNILSTRSIQEQGLASAAHHLTLLLWCIRRLLKRATCKQPPLREGHATFHLRSYSTTTTTTRIPVKRYVVVQQQQQQRLPVLYVTRRPAGVVHIRSTTAFTCWEPRQPMSKRTSAVMHHEKMMN